jgi:pyruvate dehydrogenase E2 component (dihydrolipoyllysine-residue acetyltransferase)
MTTGGAVAVEVPDIGDFADVPVIEILVSPGDRVGPDDPLVTLESDKATPLVTISPDGDGGVSRAASSAASQGAPEEAVAPDSVASAVEAETAAGASSAAGPAPASPPSAPPRNGGPVYASPSVRRVGRELGVDLSLITGTGRKGRITREDVEQAAAGGSPARPGSGPAAAPGGLGLAPWPSLEFEKFGPVERVPRSRIQRISAPNLARNWVMIPHVTQHDETDITELEAWRRQLNQERARDGLKVTMVSFLVVASIAALKEFPDFNSSLDGEELILKRYYNIGFAADTPGGLVVPVIKDADRKGLLDIARELAELSSRAREGKLGPGDMAGSTFTISSLGGIGGTAFTPIVNAPEVAILGVSRAATKPVWDGEAFVPRLMLPLSLSYDHRVIDGAAAARFVVYLGQVLGDLRRALL